MNFNLEVIYEDGVLKPVEPLKGYPEHSHIHIVIIPDSIKSADKFSQSQVIEDGEDLIQEIKEIWNPSLAKLEKDFS